MKEYVIAADVGGTRLKTGLVDLNGKVFRSNVISSRANEGAELLYQTLLNFIQETIEEQGQKILGVGLSLSGGTHPDKGVVLLPGKFKMLEGFPIVPMLRQELGLPVYADNDGRLAMYAAKYFGLAKDVDWAMVLTIGTGVGSGVMLDGQILSDPHLQFGTQMGHIIMDKSSDNFCLTGNHGTGETQCSATALSLQVRNAVQRGIPSLLTDEYYNNPLDIDFKKVIDACRMGDGLCLHELDTWINNLAILLINAVHCYAPERIILSGGATLAADLFLDKVKSIVNSRVFRYPKGEPVDIVIGESNEFSGVIGAAAFLMKKLNKI
jgi:glucokinase